MASNSTPCERCVCLFVRDSKVANRRSEALIDLNLNLDPFIPTKRFWEKFTSHLFSESPHPQQIPFC